MEIITNQIISEKLNSYYLKSIFQFCFFIRCSMLEVRCWTFIFKTSMSSVPLFTLHVKVVNIEFLVIFILQHHILLKRLPH